MRKILGILIVCTAALSLWALPCGAKEIPRRIVSLAPSFTRQIYDLKMQDRLVGITSFCPKYAQGKEIIGSLTALNFEKICALKPDLILASTDSNKKADIEKLSSLGLAVEVFEGCESFECMCRGFIRLGDLLGKGKEARSMVADVRSRLDSMRSKIAGRQKLRVFWQMGTNPLVTAGDETFTGEIIRLAGCENIFSGVRTKYPRVNIESVLTRNPEVIFIVSDMEGARVPLSVWKPFKDISAVKDGRVYVMSADTVCQPTPAMFLKSFQAVIARLYPGVI
ncbi:MAG TPA: helical backbone metal receptor [Deltaproteobacteria bacterium]|jgi:iron complex transport system substrate-binding protein|nr:helical backbone metal receptor [Deltaproteobacteria bacterium]HQH99720.1 helical backbone metal receptor [Deltaproteobacteria bacterium]